MLYWIWLTLVEGLGPIRQRSLLHNFSSPEAIFNANLEELLKCEGIGKKSANNILKSKSLEKAESILEDSNRLGIKLLNLEDNLYPQEVKNIMEMPILLYYKGNLIENSRGVAIVGARRCTDYGKNVAHEAASFLADENICLISGMAKGIDSYAHTSSLKRGGYTIAVFGNGLDICYPPEHIELMNEIIKKGAIISEYPPGTPASPKHFPRRNLIISAWSHKILVIEAAKKSGSLITADYGKLYAREVLALPDNIFNRESVGSNKLILEGAEIFLDNNQLLIDEKYRYKEKTTQKPTIEKKEIELDPQEKTIMNILSSEGVHTTEELSEKMEIPQMELVSKLSLMDLEGKITIKCSKIEIAKEIF